MNPVTFTARAKAALADASLGAAMRATTGLLESRRAEAVAAEPAFEALRERARFDKFASLRDLAGQLERFESAVLAQGGKVHWAADAEEASGIIAELLASHGATKVVKSKSMVTEEVELNHALEARGIQAVETDLGEYVAQLKGEKPSHIILPIIHLTRGAVAKLFRSKGLPAPTDEVKDLVETARLALRREFETADAGITGANFAVADQGALCIVSNEGNARFVTSLPRLHIALLGIEKLVPDLDSLSVFLRLLARSATGQRLTVYSNLLWPGRLAGDGSGARESHVVLLDNGRTRLLASAAAEILACIRCGACLNACPIYKSVGGHAYGGTYPGPMGSILSPALGEKGASERQDLALASSLCGACRDACPLKIDIPRMLLHTRAERARGTRRGWIKALAFRAWSLAAARPRFWAAALSLPRLAASWLGKEGWLEPGPRLPFGWTRVRQLRLPAKQSFLAQWKARKEEPDAKQP